MDPEAAGSLLIRIALALLFLQGVWACCRDAEAWRGATADAALVFKRSPRLATLLGMIVAAIGALSVLFGIFPRIGALAMAIFLVPAALIHFAKQRQAATLAARIAPSLADDAAGREALGTLTASTALGNYTAGLKNLTLIAPALYLVLAGARDPMLIGLGPGWQLYGLLIHP